MGQNMSRMILVYSGNLQQSAENFKNQVLITATKNVARLLSFKVRFVLGMTLFTSLYFDTGMSWKILDFVVDHQRLEK